MPRVTTQELSLDAVKTVMVDLGNGQREINIKNYVKIEKLPGGALEDSKVLRGVMFQKDVVAPGRMRRRIPNPRILLMDCPIEYKKGENQTNVELMKEEDWCVHTAPGAPGHASLLTLQFDKRYSNPISLW